MTHDGAYFLCSPPLGLASSPGCWWVYVVSYRSSCGPDLACGVCLKSFNLLHPCNISVFGYLSTWGTELKILHPGRWISRSSGTAARFSFWALISSLLRCCSASGACFSDVWFLFPLGKLFFANPSRSKPTTFFLLVCFYLQALASYSLCSAITEFGFIFCHFLLLVLALFPRFYVSEYSDQWSFTDVTSVLSVWLDWLEPLRGWGVQACWLFTMTVLWRSMWKMPWNVINCILLWECRQTYCTLSMYFLFMAGHSLWTAAVLHLGLISWLNLTNTRSWPTTAASCKNITTRTL